MAAHYSLGTALAQQGKNQEAIAHFTEVLRIKPDYTQARVELCLTYLMTGDKPSAMGEYEILKKTNPDLADMLYRKISK